MFCSVRAAAQAPGNDGRVIQRVVLHGRDLTHEPVPLSRADWRAPPPGRVTLGMVPLERAAAETRVLNQRPLHSLGLKDFGALHDSGT